MLMLVYFVILCTQVARPSFLENLEKPDVREIKMRLEEGKAKRLLLQNDVEVLMLKFEQLERTCRAPADEESKLTAQPPVSFTARLSAHTTISKPNIIRFDQVLQNQGNGYSPNTGVFKAPFSGTYVFSLALLTRKGGEDVHAAIMKNAMGIGRIYARDVTYGDQSSITVVTSLAENDEVYAREISASSVIHGDSYCTFSGFRI